MNVLIARTVSHILISWGGVFLAAFIGVVLGIILTRIQILSGIVIGVAEILQTIPSLAMLALLMMVFGLGNSTAVAAIFLYSLLPIVRNTYTALKEVPKALLEAGRGMGMNKLQLLFQVELPNAFPVILSGIRVSLITAYGIVTIAVLVGGGGLGGYIYRGTQTVDMRMILTGAIPIFIMAVGTDFFLNRLEDRLHISK
ncbi:ABC transporter permease [Anaeropeptidivorans aminofermentans]|jgi:osmoprotectant transport system permease protein|uniref:ABC transporter permease n=1 Tax=Anaeropeptidivorans aminofermentans TaxID=2934315 RepID=UPI002025AFA5|nr:ABC transporter permease [Anaeropeptidivorans aminofermentans]MBE6011346.1 ABC transporter permease [Lachnospiraceae bacterium]